MAWFERPSASRGLGPFDLTRNGHQQSQCSSADRSVTARDISRSVVVTGSGNAVSLSIGGSGVVLPLLRKQIRPPARRWKVSGGERQRELDILNPELSQVPLIGRGALLDDLVAWLDADEDISVHAVVGRAGSGKTRLAIELCGRIDSAPEVGAWAAGFLSPTELGSIVETLATQDFEWQRPTLLVIDYAGQSHTAIARWLDRLAYQQIGAKLRILLLEREAPQGFGWWHELTGSGLNSAAARQQLFHDQMLRPFALPGLEALEERRQVIAAALHRTVALWGQSTPAVSIPAAGSDAGFDARLVDVQFANPLTLVMAGVLAHGQGAKAALALRRLDSARRLARRELDRLKALAGPSQAGAMAHLIAFNGLTGGLPLVELSKTLSNELAAAGLTGDVDRLATLLQQELPATGEDQQDASVTRLGTVQPDLIGEGLTIEALSGQPAVRESASALVERAYALSDHRAANALMRLLQDYAYALEDVTSTEEERSTAQWVMSWLTHLANRIDNPEALVPLVDALPQQTTVLREAALDLTRRMADASRQVYAASGALDDARAAAAWLSNLSTRLSALGQLEAAVTAAEEASAIDRRLAEASPEIFARSLAFSLSNLSKCLTDLRRRDEALAIAEEALALHRALAAVLPRDFNPRLGVSLSNYAVVLSDLGRREEALAAAEEAVTLRRALASTQPDEFNPDLAQSLHNLANILSDAGRQMEALEAVEEAVGIFRELAAASPDAFNPSLATALNNLTGQVSALGRPEEALVIAEEFSCTPPRAFGRPSGCLRL